MNKVKLKIKLPSIPMKWVFGIYFLALFFIVYRNISLPWGDLFLDGGYYSHYNNYIIFKQSFFHLIDNKNLYVHYPSEQYDLFKYTPTFALLFAPFSILPDFLGYFLWTALNLFLPLLAVIKLNSISSKAKTWMLVLLLLEGFTSALNSQSNGLMLGLLLYAFVNLEQERWIQAVFCLWITVFIKLFGIFFFTLFLIYPQSWKSAALSSVLILAVLFALPLPFAGGDLISQYESMVKLLAHDHGFFLKYSVMGWLKQWFGFNPPKNQVLWVGILLQLVVLLLYCIKYHFSSLSDKQADSDFISNQFKWLYIGTWLIWVVIFNHMAESATYVIAVGGIVMIYANLWNSQQEESIQWQVFWILGLLLVVLFTILGPTDIYPKPWRLWIVESAQLKAFPCILIWALTQVKLTQLVLSKPKQA